MPDVWGGGLYILQGRLKAYKIYYFHLRVGWKYLFQYLHISIFISNFCVDQIISTALASQGDGARHPPPPPPPPRAKPRYGPACRLYNALHLSPKCGHLGLLI